jgi:hypothetical protein
MLCAEVGKDRKLNTLVLSCPCAEAENAKSKTMIIDQRVMIICFCAPKVRFFYLLNAKTGLKVVLETQKNAKYKKKSPNRGRK